MTAPVENLVQRLHAKRSGKGWQAKCLAHDDHRPSLSIDEGADGRALVICRAGCDTNDVLAALAMTPADLFIKSPSTTYQGQSSNGAFDWSSCVNAFTAEDIERLAKWRGFSLKFVQELKDKRQIGMYDGLVAFPVLDRGNVIGAHFRINRDVWNYTPRGIKIAPLLFGRLTPGERVQLFESTWDGLDYMDKSGDRDGVIVTRGASNGRLVVDVLPERATLFLWPQNDAPGAKWAKDVCANVKCEVKRVKIPAPHKDLNDWTRAGATSDDLLDSMLKAEMVQEAAPVWSPDKLFGEMKAYITRYVVFSQPEHANVIALWVMHTWVSESCDFTPYIYLHSPVMRCGKTQVHRIVEPLVKNPLRTCNISESALFREITDSHPTLLWDEVDSIFGSRKASEANENKRALLNAGYERGIPVIRMERSGGGFQKISYDPFCPKILAGIGRLPDTIVDRSIPILIHRKLKTQLCQKYRRQDRAAAKPLRDALESWSKDPELQKTLRERQPQMPECLTDRQEDIWEPLLAIADSIGGDVPRLAREAALVLCDNGEDEVGYGATQLLAIKKVVVGQDRISSADLINGLWESDSLPSRLMEDDRPNHKKIGHWLSKFIKSYGGKPARKLRFGEQTLMGYEAADLAQVFDRYCPREQG